MPIAKHVNLVAFDRPLGQRVGVMGAGGKSTLAGAIARKMDLELIEIDWIQHMPGWKIRPPDDVKRIVDERMRANPRGWVTDHHSTSIIPMILERAQSVVVLGLPLRTVFWRRLKRSMRRSWTKEIVCGGNTETFWQNFATRESALLEILQKRKRYSTIAETVSKMAPPDLDFYHIQTARQLDEFYEAQGLSRYTPETSGDSKTARGA